MKTPLTADLLLRAYAIGLFPMAESADDPKVFWVDPDERGILPLDAFHVPHRLRRTVRQQLFEIRCNTAFADVVRGCAAPAPDRPSTWINASILQVYTDLHTRGFAHSIEAWEGNALVGGLYGVSLRGAFFGESMFSRVTDASKVALVYLIAQLISCGFTLLDTQFVTSHLKRFGAVEIPRTDYKRRLATALSLPARFQPCLPSDPLGIIQSITQTS